MMLIYKPQDLFNRITNCFRLLVILLGLNQLITGEARAQGLYYGVNWCMLYYGTEYCPSSTTTSTTAITTSTTIPTTTSTTRTTTTTQAGSVDIRLPQGNCLCRCRTHVVTSTTVPVSSVTTTTVNLGGGRLWYGIDWHKVYYGY